MVAARPGGGTKGGGGDEQGGKGSIWARNAARFQFSAKPFAFMMTQVDEGMKRIKKIPFPTLLQLVSGHILLETEDFLQARTAFSCQCSETSVSFLARN